MLPWPKLLTPNYLSTKHHLKAPLIQSILPHARSQWSGSGWCQHSFQSLIMETLTFCWLHFSHVPDIHHFQQLSKNLLNVSGHFAELLFYGVAPVESYCACLVPTQVRRIGLAVATTAVVICVILEVRLNSVASVIRNKHRHLLTSLTEAV